MNIMVIGAHPDDAELGMGGTIATFIQQNHKIYILDITNGEPTPFGTIKKRLKEADKSAKILGVDKRIILEFPNRYLFDNIKVRIKVAEWIRLLKPEILFLPYYIDAHPDHIAASKIGIAARFYAKLTKTEMKGIPFFPSKVYFYFCIHLNLNIKPSFIFSISKENFNKKLIALKIYKSQFYHKANRNILQLVKNNGKFFGNMINSEYGEPFYTDEYIGIKSIDAII